MKKVTTFVFLLCALMVAAIAAAATDGKITSTTVHEEMGLSCADCHNTDTPEKRAPASTCKGCHENMDGTYKGILGADGKPEHKDYPEGTGYKNASFHDSHQGDIRCTMCHTAHQAPVLYCNECHDFKVEVK